MSKHSRNDGRQPEQYARLSESPSEDESDEEFRQFLLTKGDRNDPAVRDMLKTIDRDKYERSAANGGPTLEYESHGLLALTVPHLHGPRPGRRAFGMRGVVLRRRRMGRMIGGRWRPSPMLGCSSLCLRRWRCLRSSFTRLAVCGLV